MPPASLRQIRKTRNMMPADLAAGVDGLFESRVSNIETRGLTRQRIDTLSRYIRLLGGELVVTVAFPDEVVILQDPQPRP